MTFKEWMIQSITCAPALYVLMLGMDCFVHNPAGQAVGAILLITVNNFGINLANYIRGNKK